jgi:uncharacterized membrane protein YqaE (UPF0057 family)
VITQGGIYPPSAVIIQRGIYPPSAVIIQRGIYPPSAVIIQGGIFRPSAVIIQGGTVGIFLPVVSVSYFLSYSQFINGVIIMNIKVLLPRYK